MDVPGRSNDGHITYPELSTLICGPCKDEGQRMVAAGFCADCNEYLCDVCFKHHNRARPFKDHSLQDINDTPCQHLIEKDKTNVNICYKHERERVRFYCKTHRELGCGLCIVKNHKSCEETVAVCDEYSSFDSSLKRLKQEFTKQAGYAEEHIPRIDTIKEDAVSAMKRFHKEMIETSNKLENDSMEEIMKLKNKDAEKIKTISEKCASNLNDIDALSTDLCQLYESKRTGELFLKLEERQTQLLQMETTLRTIHRDNGLNEYRFEPSCQLSTMLQSLDSLGTMRSEKEINAESHTEEESEMKMEHTEMKDSDDVERKNVPQNLDDHSVSTNGVQSRRHKLCNRWIIGAVGMLIIAMVISVLLHRLNVNTDPSKNIHPGSFSMPKHNTREGSFRMSKHT